MTEWTPPQGYAYKGDKQVFPVVLGEFGSWLGDRRNGCNVRGCMDQELSVRPCCHIAA